MKIRHRTLLLGLLLIVLLVGGLAAAVLWPTPSEAKREAALLHVGMNIDEAFKLLGPGEVREFHTITPQLIPGSKEPDFALVWLQRDGSTLIADVGHLLGNPEEGFYREIASIRTTPAAPADPLTRLGKTLARAFPFLAE
jgi:hypothetical protein